MQFRLQMTDPPPQPPEWLRSLGRWLRETLEPVGRFLRRIGSFMPDAPYARIILWTLLAVLALALAWIIVERVRTGGWAFRLPWRRRRATTIGDAKDEEWAPDVAPAREWLREADELAGQGRFAEAAHHLLLRSVEDIARRWPTLVQPAITSRELAVADMLPGGVRQLFADIAALVERSLFGKRPVDAGDWRRARAAYAEFALPGNWRG